MTRAGTGAGVAGGTEDPWAALPGWSPAAFAAAKAACPRVIEALSLSEFEASHTPQQIRAAIHLTAYYEPILPASRTATPGFPTPVLGLPSDPAALAADRAAIESGALEGRAPALFWLAGPVALFFVQIQGSARLEFADGSTARIGYAGRNKHPYVSIGAMLRQQAGLEDLDAEALRAWLLADEERGRALMARNPSYIFFREVPDVPGTGPIGAWGRALPAGHALAVDPSHHTYGDMMWIERGDTGEADLWIAMDTGAAIRGPGRFDLFLGSGAGAQRAASSVNTAGRAWRLVPRAGDGS